MVDGQIRKGETHRNSEFSHRDDSYLGQELRNSSVLSKVNSFVSVSSKAYKPISPFVFVNDKQCYLRKMQ